MHKKIFIVGILLSMMFLCGCWDNVELNERAFVITLGIDKISKGERNKNEYNEYEKFKVTYEIVKSNDSEGEKEEESSQNKIVKIVTSSSLTGSIMDVEEVLNKNIYMGHLKLVVLGEELLKDKEMVKEIIDVLERMPQITRKVLLMGSSTDSVESLLKVELKTQPMVGLYIFDLINNNAAQMSTIPVIDLNSFTRTVCNTNGNIIIPALSLDNNELVIKKSALIDNYSLIGWFDLKQTRAVYKGVKDTIRTQLTVEFNDTYVPCIIDKSKSKTDYYEYNNKLVLKKEIKAEGYLTEYKFLSNEQLFNEKIIKTLEKKYSNLIEDEVLRAYDILQKIYNSDLIGVNFDLKKKNYKLWKKYTLDWNKSFKDMLLDIDVDVEIRRIGMIK